MKEGHHKHMTKGQGNMITKITNGAHIVSGWVIFMTIVISSMRVHKKVDKFIWLPHNLYLHLYNLGVQHLKGDAKSYSWCWETKVTYDI